MIRGNHLENHDLLFFNVIRGTKIRGGGALGTGLLAVAFKASMLAISLAIMALFSFNSANSLSYLFGDFELLRDLIFFSNSSTC